MVYRKIVAALLICLVSAGVGRAQTPAQIERAKVEEANRKAEEANRKMKDMQKAMQIEKRQRDEKTAALEEELRKLKNDAKQREADNKPSSTLLVSQKYAAGQTVSHPLKDGGNGPEMVVVPAGSYWMGAAQGEVAAHKDEFPQHKVTIGYDIGVGKYEVTKGQFAKFVQASGYKTDAEKNGECYVFNPKENTPELRADASWRAPGFDSGFKQDDSHPVVCASWNDAKAYVGWLSEQTGKTYRLPSEAEWEYAARGEKAGGQASKSVPWSVAENHKGMCAYANGRDERLNRIQPVFLFAGCDDGYEYTEPVGKKLANAFGLYDMHGNASEWTEDCYHGTYNFAPADGSVWVKGCQKEIFRVRRGGSWASVPAGLRSASRGLDPPDSRNNYSGLRVAWTLP